MSEPRPAPGVEPCPECRADKCGNCNGVAWDFDLDEAVTCPCHAKEHQ